MSDTYTHPPHGMSEYDSLMIDGENIDPRALSYELADDPDLYLQATEDLDTTTYEYNQVAEENYATLMGGGEPTDEEGEREATLRHKTEVLSAAVDPTAPDPIETHRDLNSPEEQRASARAAHELQGLVADLINDIRIDYFAKSSRMKESDEHTERREKVAAILREFPSLSDQIEQRLKQYEKSDESHYDSTDDEGNLKQGKLSAGEEAYIAARDKDISRDAFAAPMTTVAEIKMHIDANKAEGKHVVKAAEYADLDTAIYGGLKDIMDDTGYYQYDKGQGKDPAEFYEHDIDRENATQERLRSEMVEALYEWRESRDKNDEAKVFTKMLAMHKHMAELNDLAEDVPLRHSYHDTLRSQRERMMQSILSTRYMREQVRISEAARLTPGAMDFHGRRPVGYNADKSIDIGGINLYPDGILGLPGAGGHDEDGNPITLYIHPDGERTITKKQPFPMDELPTVTYTRSPEPPVPPVDTALKGLERVRAHKQYAKDVEARKQRELAHIQEIADGKIMEDDRDIPTLLVDYNEADKHLFANQADQEAIEDFREVAHIARQRVSEALQAELRKPYPDEDTLAEMQRVANQMTYRLNVIEANHTDKKYAMAPDGTIATRDTMNQRAGYWMIREDGSARRVTRDPATGRRRYSGWFPPTGDF